jgi:hypothetical protein
MDLVRTEDRNRPLRELLNLTPRAFLGVDADAEAALEKLEIKTIFDLATTRRMHKVLAQLSSRRAGRPRRRERQRCTALVRGV